MSIRILDTQIKCEMQLHFFSKIVIKEANFQNIVDDNILRIIT